MPTSGRGERGEKQQSISPLPYAVDMTASAESVYKDLYLKCKAAKDLGHSENAHCTTFSMIQEAVKKIIPNDPHSKAHALRGHLSNLFRLRKGRWRIVWIASSAQRRVCILYISETMRKDGDPNDPYEVFQRQYDSGQFDEILQHFGVRVTGTKRK